MWLFLGLLTAFLTSLVDVLGRKALNRVDVYTMAWAWPFFSAVAIGPMVFFQPIPPLGPLFWPAALSSTVILTVSFVYYAKAIQSADLSLTVPMLTFTPLLLLITSPLMLRESPKFMGFWGIILIVIGSYLLNFKERANGYFAPFHSLWRVQGARYMLFVALLYSIGANVDKIGVQNSSPVFWIFTIYGLSAIPLSLIFWKKVVGRRSQLKRGLPLFILMGILGALANVVQMVAINMTIVPYLIAVKRTSVFITSLFGFWMFKESGFRERAWGAALMVLGVFVIAFSQ